MSKIINPFPTNYLPKTKLIIEDSFESINVHHFTLNQFPVNRGVVGNPPVDRNPLMPRCFCANIRVE